MAAGVAVDDPIPLELRANDAVTHVVNIDSEFRDSGGADAGAFQLSLLSPVRNVLRVRLASVDIPAEWLVWSADRRNTSVEVFYRDVSGILMSVRIFVEDAVSYTAEELVTALTASIVEVALPIPLTVTWNPVKGGRFVFESGSRFGIRGGSGLAAAMGFGAGLHASTRGGGGDPYTLRSQQCVDLGGDRYLFLRVNDYAAVRQTITGPKRHDFVALAKIWRSAEGDWQWSGGTVVFPAPMDVSRFQVQVVDRYGEVVPVCGVSFALEVLEVRNSTMYNMVRNGLAVTYL